MGNIVSEADNKELRILHSISGRIRLHLPAWPEQGQTALEMQFYQIQGISRVQANTLTSNILIYFDVTVTSVQTILEKVSTLDWQNFEEASNHIHSLPVVSEQQKRLARSKIYEPTTARLVLGALRTAGAVLGLGLLAVLQLLGLTEPLPGASIAAQTATTIAVVQSVPVLRYGLRKLLGYNTASILTHLPNILALTFANRPLDLTIQGAEGLRLLTANSTMRTAQQRYEEQVQDGHTAQPRSIIQLETGERTPFAAHVIEGTGTAVGSDGLPLPVYAGSVIPSGAKLYGGFFTLRLQDRVSSPPAEYRPRHTYSMLFDRYLQILSPLSLLYAVATALITHSWSQGIAALLRFNPRTAMIGGENADLGAFTRVARAGVIVTQQRAQRTIQRPHSVLLDGIRPLTNGLELNSVVPLTEAHDTQDVLARAAGVALVAGSPWGGIFRAADSMPATNGSFDGTEATAYIEGIRYTLGPVTDWSALSEAAALPQQGYYVLLLRCEREEHPLALFAFQLRLAAGIETLMQVCLEHNIELAIVSKGHQLTPRAFAARTHLSLIEDMSLVEAIQLRQRRGERVACLSDSVVADEAFDLCDLAIGLVEERSQSPMRADLLVPDLQAVSTVLETSVQRDATVRNAVGLSLVANIVGTLGGLQGREGTKLATQIVSITSLGTLAEGWLRLRGGERSGDGLAHLVDPHPERWGQRSIEQVLHILRTSEMGLSTREALERRQVAPLRIRHRSVLSLLLEQLRSPLIATYVGSAVFAFFLGAGGDSIIILMTVLANVALGVWQEYKANRVTETLEYLGTSTAQVMRDGETVTIRATDVVPGDILLLASGKRVAADARLLSAHNLEVDEAALTGESLPVPKVTTGGSDASRIVLEGSDITSGTGRAIVVAVGRQTRMGATVAALSTDETEQSPLGVRLNRFLRILLPLSVAGGGVVTATGFFHGQSLITQLALGVTVVLAVIPEGLPLLASVGEAAVARRLASRSALVRRLSSVEALGRVDVVCTDKTGTLTQGHLAVSLVADIEQDTKLPGELSEAQRRVLLTAALASPDPDAPDAYAHPTDMAVIQAAHEAGLDGQLRMTHTAELAFDPVRAFHATVVDTRLCLKGAPEVLAARCSWSMHGQEKRPIDDIERQHLLTQARLLAERGLRVLMVAEGTPENRLDDPSELTALGFIGISDPLRPIVHATIRRCREAGVRVIMITGDHPATAQSIAQEAGLFAEDGSILTGSQLMDLSPDELAARLEQTVVIARATPLDKLRIIESLRRHNHTVAMTGDGVNDAPALRLADVGVAMGRGGTEVARQTADVVLADDDFSTLVEALIEGRSFWRNIRRSLSLLLGGNLGELGVVVGASLLGNNLPLTARQILAMNVITDLLPATSVALQKPELRNLAGLNREGAAALDAPLRNDLLRRATATAVPALASYLIMQGTGMPTAASTVAFGSVISTQLAQTLMAGRAEGHLTRSVAGAVLGSGGMLLMALTVPPLRSILDLVAPSALGWTLIGAGAPVAVMLNHLLASIHMPGTAIAPYPFA